jgi:hypothetical protein
MIKHLANTISLVFHPIFVLPWAILLLSFFGFFEIQDDEFLSFFCILIGFGSILPIIIVLILKQLKLVSSIRIPNKNERPIPYIATIISYCAMIYFLGSNIQIPRELAILIFSSILSLIFLYFTTPILKISAHLTAMGGLCFGSYFLIRDFFYPIENLFYLSFILSGIVAWSRLELKAHTKKEVYLGFLVGTVGQIIGFWLL